MILDQRKKFPETIPGYSDHTLPGNMDVLKTATLLGAVILEKHFTYDKSLPGNDHYHAMDKEDLKYFFKDMDKIFEIIVDFKKKPIESEEKSILNARRSLVAKRKISAGEEITAEDITWKRPGLGISPKFLDDVIGKKALTDIEEDTALKWNMLN